MNEQTKERAKKADKYLPRIEHRRDVLRARLETVPLGASFRPEIQKELNAVEWSLSELSAANAEIAALRARVEDAERERDAALQMIEGSVDFGYLLDGKYIYLERGLAGQLSGKWVFYNTNGETITAGFDSPLEAFAAIKEKI